MTESTLPRIRVLPTQLANQIAAGEVVERPASVVKELLENSLDAGARRIHVDVEGGGERLIRVRDDGHGIPREDLQLALSSHATGKIGSLNDLENVRSLGFRGEALPSIASVSRLILSSCISVEAGGWRVVAEGREARPDLEPVAHPRGTTVEVRDLFHNTPARRKFLRTQNTEYRNVEKMVRRVALSRFDVGIVLRHNERQVFALAPATSAVDRQRRIAALCGAGFAREALQLHLEGPGMEIRGWLAPPPACSNRTEPQQFFVNARTVRDRLITHAVRQGYEQLLSPGHQPAFALFLELEPAEVDVNVHPTKHEVRFRDSRLVHDFIFRSVRRALAPGEGDPGERWVSRQPDDRPAPDAGFAWGAGGSAVAHGARESSPGYPNLGSTDAGRFPAPASGSDTGPLGTALAQFAGRYVLAGNGGGLLVVDAARARTRILAQRLQAGYLGDGIRRAPLLLPLMLEIGERACDAVEARVHHLAALGIELGRTGPETVVVRQVPALARDADVERLVRAVVAQVVSLAPEPLTDELASVLLALMARHAGPPEDEPMSLVAMNALLRDLEGEGGVALEGDVWVRWSTTEIQDRFRKIL